jgi:hypothetical protein
MRYILFGILGLFIILNVEAQETFNYHLRTLSADEFISELPDFSDIPLPDYQDTLRNQTALGIVIRTAEAEFLSRYEDESNFATLIAAFEKFKLPIYCYPVPRCTYQLPEIDYGAWFNRIVSAWLEENPTDLDSVDTLQFQDFTVYIEQRDFNADGQHEWLLDVVKGQEEIEYAHYLVVSRSEQGYIISTVPLGGTLSWWRHTMFEQPLAELGFEDINADGLPEWILYWTRLAGAFGTISYDSPHKVILGWRDGQVIRLADIYENSYLENVDDDEALEILTTSHFYGDYWGCGYREEGEYDWNGQQYVEVEPHITPLDCTARHAEDAMWAWDFETAIELYDSFIDSHTEDYESFRDCWVANELDCDYNHMNRDTLIYFHFQVRRILAHALSGHQEQVQDLLMALSEEPYITDFAQAVLDADTTDVETLCRAAYNYFAEQHTFLNSFEEERRFYPGNSLMDDGVYTVFNKPIDPIRAGCDIRMFSSEPTPVPSPTWSPYPTPIPPTPDTRTQEQIWLDNQDFYDAFAHGDYETALAIAQHAAPTDEFIAGQWAYARAITYEALNLPEEALLEYVTLYEDIPQSVWGLLAAIHLESLE